jgi:hypothetical protein
MSFSAKCVWVGTIVFAIGAYGNAIWAQGTRAGGIPDARAGQTIRQSREEFAAAFARIKEGMPAEEVRTLLGEPDDIRTQNDPGGISLTGTREIWGYGTDRHLGFATLGTVTIDSAHHVQYFKGTKGAHELVAQFGEIELRRLLRLVARASLVRLATGDLNPRDTLAAINTLYPMGKKTGVALMAEYLDVSFNWAWTQDEGLFLVMRGLFEPPPVTQGAPETRIAYGRGSFGVVEPGYFRPPAIAVATWADPKAFPRFPLVIIDDIPLVPTWRVGMGGRPESASAHLQKLEANAPGWRQEALKPTDDPLGVFAKLFAILPPDAGRNELEPIVAYQLLRLVDTVYRDPAIEAEDFFYPPERAMAVFTKATEKVRALKIHWDMKAGCYVFADGTTLPAVVKPSYRRNTIEHHFAGDPDYRLQVFVERKNGQRVDMGIELDDPTGTAPAIQVRLVVAENPEKVLADALTAGTSAVTVTAGQSRLTGSFGPVELPAGKRVRVEIIRGKERFVGPEIEP